MVAERRTQVRVIFEHMRNIYAEPSRRRRIRRVAPGTGCEYERVTFLMQHNRTYYREEKERKRKETSIRHQVTSQIDSYIAFGRRGDDLSEKSALMPILIPKSSCSEASNELLAAIEC